MLVEVRSSRSGRVLQNASRARYYRPVAIVLNDAFYPIVLVGMYEPYSAEEVDDYFTRLLAIFKWGVRTHTRHVVILIHDPTQASAAGRRQMAEAHKQRVTRAQNELTLACFVPIDNAIMRGMITAFSWFAPDIVKTLRCVATMEDALQQALQVLAAQGTPFVGDMRALRAALKLNS
jgi:hypothetical protein